MKSEFDHCLEPYMTQTLEVALGSVDHAVEEAKKAAAELAEKARIAAEKRLEMERIEKEEQERKERERLAEEKARKEAEEKARKEAEEKAAAERLTVETPAEPVQIESDAFDDDGDMYGSDSE